MSTRSMANPPAEELETPKARSLYKLDGELDEIISALESGDFTDEEINAAIDAWFEANVDEITTKVDGYGYKMQETDNRDKFLRAEAEALRKMAAVEKKVHDTLEARLKAFLERTGRSSLPTAHFKPHIRGNGSVKPLVVSPEMEADPRLLPPQFWTITPNNEAIRKALEAGEEVPGCYLAKRSTHLRLR